MAKNGITNYGDGLDRFLFELYAYLQTSGNFMGLSAEDFLIEKVRLRGREFNTLLNNSEEERRLEEQKRIVIEIAAEAYRKASKGG